MRYSIMSALPAQGLGRTGLLVVALEVEVCVGTTAGPSSLTMLSSSGLTAQRNTITETMRNMSAYRVLRLTKGVRLQIDVFSQLTVWKWFQKGSNKHNIYSHLARDNLTHAGCFCHYTIVQSIVNKLSLIWVVRGFWWAGFNDPCSTAMGVTIKSVICLTTG